MTDTEIRKAEEFNKKEFPKFKEAIELFKTFEKNFEEWADKVVMSPEMKQSTDNP